MNIYLQKKENKSRIWKSLNGISNNNVIISNNKNIVLDMSVINSVKVGSDHRIVRSKIYFNIKIEQYKLITIRYKAIEVEELKIKQEQYHHKLKNCMVENILYI